jgi:hypothetical protein
MTLLAQSNPPSAADHPEMTDLLASLVREIDEIAVGCTALQWSISSLLDKVDHPDLAEEIHMLQDIDRMQQTLVDIAAVLGVVSGPVATVRLPQGEIDAVIKLESLRQRLWDAPAASEQHDEHGNPMTDITWL